MYGNQQIYTVQSIEKTLLARIIFIKNIFGKYLVSIFKKVFKLKISVKFYNCKLTLTSMGEVFFFLENQKVYLLPTYVFVILII